MSAVLTQCIRAVEARVIRGDRELQPTLQILRWLKLNEAVARTAVQILNEFPGATLVRSEGDDDRD